MQRNVVALLGMLGLLFAPDIQAAQQWIEGKDYFLVDPVQPTSVPRGKVEVMEVFSYGCVWCNRVQPVIDRLKRELPANAALVFLPASFNPAEDWPMFQRVFFAAQSLGIAERTHQAMFDAIWMTDELAILESGTHTLKRTPPSLEEAAHCYERLTGIKSEKFLAAANSPGVDAKMKAADAQIKAMHVPGTPCLIVNGKYRIEAVAGRSPDDVIKLVGYLVAQENGH